MALIGGSGTIGASFPTNYEYFTADGITQGLNADQSYFTLNDKLIRIYSGAMHYFRVPRTYWRDRLKKIRAAGLNTVETYVPWNLHEPQSGKYDFGTGGSDFEDFLHLEEFLNTAKEEDLFVILRTGPYICSEYNFGGFPSWLLGEKTIGFRTSEPTYMKYVTRYFNILLTLLAAFQFTKGGPVIAFQVENEYGNQEAGDAFQPDKVYLEQLHQLFLDNGIVELLVTSDSPLSHQDKGTLPGIFLQTANFGQNVEKQFDKLEELQPGRPLMAMEYWVGFYDFWGTNHSIKTDEETRLYLGQILDRNASFNAYMFLGGTNFAFNSGATFANDLLDNSGFEPITTSYDYDSPLSENGGYKPKYYIFKEMVTAANPIQTKIPDEPEYIAPIAYESLKIDKVIPFKSMIERNSLEIVVSKNLLPMEKLDINDGSGQSNGHIVYRKENVDLAENSVLTIEGHVCDHVLVLVNGELIAPKQLKYLSDLDGFGFWRLNVSRLELNDKAISDATLDIIVEEMGRFNIGTYNQYNHTFKGLWQGNVSINGENIYDWTIIPLEWKTQWINELEGWEEFTNRAEGPAMYSSVLHITDEPQDTFVDIRGWGKVLEGELAMSATFKNAKKMERQEQLRKLLKDHKKVLKEVKKVDSPLAKYNELGQLTCILCKSIVRSEAVWVVHVNAKQHKENVELAKKLKEKTNNFTTPLKRPLTPPLPDIPEKKVKGILKNKVSQSTNTGATNNVLHKNGTSSTSQKPDATQVLSLQQMKNQHKELVPEDPGDQSASGSLPEGFFDDPIQDAKARNQEYKDPMEVEWNNFLKEMKVIENESEAIIAEDQDEATTERHMEEIEEQMVLFNRVLDLERKKDVALELLNKIKNEPRTEDEEVSDDIDEFLDWRQKKAY